MRHFAAFSNHKQEPFSSCAVKAIYEPFPYYSLLPSTGKEQCTSMVMIGRL
jgi:hypothetical protein